MIEFTLNGETVRTDEDPNTPLLWVVRDQFGLKGSKFGCGAGLCGACTMHVDGAAVRTCILPVAAVAGQDITTIEGIGSPDALHPLQVAWNDFAVPQCGYCQSGQICRLRPCWRRILILAKPRWMLRCPAIFVGAAATTASKMQ